MGCSRARTVYIWPTIRTPSAVSRAMVGVAGAQEDGWSGVLGAVAAAGPGDVVVVGWGDVVGMTSGDVAGVGWDMGTPEGGVWSPPRPVCARHDRPMAPPGSGGCPRPWRNGRGTMEGRAGGEEMLRRPGCSARTRARRAPRCAGRPG